MPAFVDSAKCTACEDCISTCPTECISLIDGKAKVNPDECTDCEACVDVCPETAISMK
ncbi:MAG TPA: 4Fe-4S binding protein [Candidatus Krumholzibacteria bacterium]|nr:4Fe-4S binding protein [Candidatus Krumholzibacteria bacterium]HPD72436.1 4Fe-4S binding protein [Candidatus Krumholzibacteria bacterium]HRY40632.1 4Fe-4S binding protein [Candidatus Krumholzibacteria bacterium]